MMRCVVALLVSIAVSAILEDLRRGNVDGAVAGR